MSTLKVNNTSLENSKQKAKALNNQFESVFTDEDLQSTPDLGTTVAPLTRDLNISEEGVKVTTEY